MTFSSFPNFSDLPNRKTLYVQAFLAFPIHQIVKPLYHSSFSNFSELPNSKTRYVSSFSSFSSFWAIYGARVGGSQRHRLSKSWKSLKNNGCCYLVSRRTRKSLKNKVIFGKFGKSDKLEKLAQSYAYRNHPTLPLVRTDRKHAHSSLFVKSARWHLHVTFSNDAILALCALYSQVLLDLIGPGVPTNDGDAANPLANTGKLFYFSFPTGAPQPMKGAPTFSSPQLRDKSWPRHANQ